MPQTATVQPATYTINDLAALLQRSLPSLHRDRELGRLPTSMIVGGRSRRWLRSTIDAWIADGCPADVPQWEARRRKATN